MLSLVCEIPFRSACGLANPKAFPAMPIACKAAAKCTEKSLLVCLLRFMAAVFLLLPASRGAIHRIQQILRVTIVVSVERPHKRPAHSALPIGIPHAVIGR